MNFEEMQAIWNSQNDEKLFVVNEAALDAYIKRKSSVINNLLGLFDWVMVVANLVVGIVLVADVLRDNESGYQLILPIMYLTFSVYSFLRRLRRRADEVRFDPTILGELDKALWRIDYLIRQGRAMTLQYTLPFVLIVSFVVFYYQKPLWIVPVTLLLIPLGYFGIRWEIDKWYLPKKRDLELLREKLLAQETQ